MHDFLVPSIRARCGEWWRRHRAGALLSIALLTGVALGLLGPALIPALAHLIGIDRPTGEAAAVLAALPVRQGEESLTDDPFGLSSGRAFGASRTGASAGMSDGAGSAVPSDSDATGSSSASYSRDAFAYQQIDADGDGCTIREDILHRDLTGIRTAGAGSGKPSCTVVTGRLRDPYTGATIAFRRGRATSSAVQIDHVVALHNAWDSGAAGWDSTKRRALGNDPQNLLAVSGPANQEKSDADASGWLPGNQRFRCEYVARQIGVKAAYGLSVTTAEKNAMRRVLLGCPGQPLVTHYPRAGGNGHDA
jgi:hypothetical protein